MTRLGSMGISPPMFFLERIERVKQDLDAEEKLLEIAQSEVLARKKRTAFLRNILDQACSRELEVLIGYNTRIPALPSQPARRRTRRQPRAARPSGPDRKEARKCKRSSSRAPPAGGVESSAYGRTETTNTAESSRTERSRKPQRVWPRSSSISRRRSESRAPSTTRVHREEDKCPSMGRVSAKSAKRGSISDLVYDDIQEERLRISCVQGGRSVEYTLKGGPDSDDEQAVINATLDDQALDLD